MRLPRRFRAGLRKMGLKWTEESGACLPQLFRGRDLVAVLPRLVERWSCYSVAGAALALEELDRKDARNGPFAVIVVSAHEMARQVQEFVTDLASQLTAQGYPELRCLLCMGGVSIQEQLQQIRAGCELIVATPGRISHLLDSRDLRLCHCKMLVIDEADRLVDPSFDKELAKVVSELHPDSQVASFSSRAIEPGHSELLARLRRPVLVQGRPCSLHELNVLHEVDYLKPEDKTLYLLQLLRKTAPPVLIFCDNKS
jgi:ATP-dependent RNA helicase DDX41